jgi:GNAT superfamily N-acetyltransferase
VLRVQVHPAHQGRGLGTVLMRGVHDIARARDLEFLHLGARGGTGVDAFYRGLGYTEVGRVPGAIRVAPGDDREEILLVHRL